MVEIKSLSSDTTFWMPPGGGVHFGESLTQAVIREVLEETGLKIEVRQMLYVSEYLKNNWHAVEFYFLCNELSGNEKLGTDPELNEDQQILKNLAWIGVDDINDLSIFPPFIRRNFKKLISGEEMILSYVAQ